MNYEWKVVPLNNPLSTTYACFDKVVAKFQPYCHCMPSTKKATIAKEEGKFAYTAARRLYSYQQKFAAHASINKFELLHY